MFEDTVKILLSRIYSLFMNTCPRTNSPVNQTNFFFFNDFLSNSADITSCVYTKTIIHLRLI